MDYGISWNEYVATEEIISPKAAFKQVEDGNFEQYVPFQQGDTLWVKECKLAYVVSGNQRFVCLYSDQCPGNGFSLALSLAMKKL
ncbi:hypothetical protein [Paenibacillus sp. J2TS4]|uniref:hypothetical protein n=1 Tax=Paenibacillus sp. J2TS4 TaxID=2807194 RepID=UPI001B1A5DF7|nr:hypothetical protein [Paenibacillus sp. J2TS4]GIP36628.1 hypothetical protein J2TS4_58380 [Paenibacillus sp. J2TS4]